MMGDTISSDYVLLLVYRPAGSIRNALSIAIVFVLTVQRTTFNVLSMLLGRYTFRIYGAMDYL